MRRYRRLQQENVSFEASLMPLLDVALCLLIVMVICITAKHPHSLSVHYQEDSGSSIVSKHALILGINQQGMLLDDGAQIQIEALSEYLAQKGLVGAVPLVLQIGTELDCGQLMHLLGRLTSLDCVESLCVTTSA